MTLQEVIDILVSKGIPSNEVVSYLQKSYDYIVQSIRLNQTIVPLRFNRAMKHAKYGDTSNYAKIVNSNSEQCFKEIIAPLNTNESISYTDRYTTGDVTVGKIVDSPSDYNYVDFDEVNERHTVNPSLYWIGGNIVNTLFEDTFFLAQVYTYPYLVTLNLELSIVVSDIENVTAGSTISIEWVQNYVGYVRVEVWNDGEVYEVLSESMLGNTIDWVTETIDISTGYTILVSSVEYEDTYGASNVFEIEDSTKSEYFLLADPSDCSKLGIYTDNEEVSYVDSKIFTCSGSYLLPNSDRLLCMTGDMKRDGVWLNPRNSSIDSLGPPWYDINFTEFFLDYLQDVIDVFGENGLLSSGYDTNNVLKDNTNNISYIITRGIPSFSVDAWYLFGLKTYNHNTKEYSYVDFPKVFRGTFAGGQIEPDRLNFVSELIHASCLTPNGDKLFYITSDPTVAPSRPVHINYYDTVAKTFHTKAIIYATPYRYMTPMEAIVDNNNRLWLVDETDDGSHRDKMYYNIAVVDIESMTILDQISTHIPTGDEVMHKAGRYPLSIMPDGRVHLYGRKVGSLSNEYILEYDGGIVTTNVLQSSFGDTSYFLPNGNILSAEKGSYMSPDWDNIVYYLPRIVNSFTDNTVIYSYTPPVGYYVGFFYLVGNESVIVSIHNDDSSERRVVRLDMELNEVEVVSGSNGYKLVAANDGSPHFLNPTGYRVTDYL